MDTRLAEEVANMYADIQEAYRDLLADVRDDAVGLTEFQKRAGILLDDLVQLKRSRIKLAESKVGTLESGHSDGG